MATLTSLKLTSAQKSVNLPAVQVRCNKLLLRLAEQQQMARAQQAGEVFTRVRHQIPFFPVFDPSTLTKSST